MVSHKDFKKIRLEVFSAKPYDKKYLENTRKELAEKTSGNATDVDFYKKIELKFHNINLNDITVKVIQGDDQSSSNKDSNVYRAVSIFVNDQCDENVIGALKEKNIKMILLRCAGFNNVDLDAAKKHGITVARVPAYSPYATAEHTVTLMMSLNRHIHKAYNRVRENNFSINGLMGFDMNGKTVGVIGTGQIGQIVCRILKAGFGCNVLAYDVCENKEVKDMKIPYVSLDELYEKSDIITLHCPLIPKKTEYMINKDSIAKMKDEVMIINASRGKLLETSAIIDGLKSKKIGAIGLDVYENEKDFFYENFSEEVIADDVLSRLLTFPNVIVTSHQAFFTKEAMHAIAMSTLTNLEKYVNGTLDKKDNSVVYLKE